MKESKKANCRTFLRIRAFLSHLRSDKAVLNYFYYELKKSKRPKKAKWEEKQWSKKITWNSLQKCIFTGLGIQRENPEGISRKSMFEKSICRMLHKAVKLFSVGNINSNFIFILTLPCRIYLSRYQKELENLWYLSSHLTKGIKNQNGNSYNICTTTTKILHFYNFL